MRHLLPLTMLLASTVLIQGCGDTAEDQSPAVPTTIKGSATLGTILSNDATACLDINNNKVCDEDEPSTQTDALGQYKIIVDGAVDDGTLVIVQDGVNLLPPPSGKHSNLQFHKPYQSSERYQNVNVFSTLVTNEMQNSPSSTYAEATETVINSAFANSVNCSFIDADLVMGDPIAEGGDFLICMNGLQYITYLNDATQIQALSPVPQRVSAADSNATLDGYIDDNSDYFDSLLASIDEYIDAIYAWWDSLWADDETVVEEPPVAEEPPVTEEPPAVTEETITRADLNGVWYIIDASGDKTCSIIDSANNISVTEADGKTTDLTLEYSDGTPKSMELSLGFFSVDTIVFEHYYSDQTFTGKYASDNETLAGYKVDTLDACKYDADKLGL